MGRGQAFEVKLGADLGPGTPLGDQLGVAATTQNQAQPVQQQGLSGTGFAGENGQARVHLNALRMNDGQMINRQSTQLALFLPLERNILGHAV